MAKKPSSSELMNTTRRTRFQSCIADAEGFASLLHTRYAFDHVNMLRDKDATKAKLSAALSALVKNVTADDRIVCYYSGHGYSFQNDNATVDALVTQDAQFFDCNEMKAIVEGVPPGTSRSCSIHATSEAWRNCSWYPARA